MREEYSRSRYYRSLRGTDSTKIRSINSVWGIVLISAGAVSGIVFCAFLFQDGFESVVLSALGIASLILVITGFMVLISYE